MTHLKHILSSSFENAARYLQHVKDSHTLFAFKLRPNIKTITGLWVWRYTFLTAKLQIYTRAQKIVVPLQMLCAWSAHCFVCQPTTNYHAPPGLRFSLPLQIYLLKVRLLLRERWSCLCRGFTSRNYYVFVSTHKMGLCMLYENSTIHQLQTSQKLRMLSRSLSDCKSLLLKVMIQSNSLSL